MLEIVQTDDYDKNFSKGWRDGGTPCVVCGRGVKPPHRYVVHVHCGGSHVVTEAEAATLPENEDLGGYPIGADCLRRNPEDRPYGHTVKG